jgi:hypothetical protein
MCWACLPGEEARCCPRGRPGPRACIPCTVYMQALQLSSVRGPGGYWAAPARMWSPMDCPPWSRVLLTASLALGLASCSSTPDTAERPSSRQAESAALFARAATVFQHPRCANCHPADDAPRQGMEARRHAFGVRRGPDNLGLPGMRCDTCHQDSNQDHGNVPGAPNWALAPLSMGWRGASAGVTCRAILDPSLNGKRSLEALVHHLTEDALVAWAWNPGAGREPPPIPHDEFRALIHQWASTGAACPP